MCIRDSTYFCLTDVLLFALMWPRKSLVSSGVSTVSSRTHQQQQQQQGPCELAKKGVCIMELYHRRTFTIHTHTQSSSRTHTHASYVGTWVSRPQDSSGGLGWWTTGGFSGIPAGDLPWTHRIPFRAKSIGFYGSYEYVLCLRKT